MSSARFGMRCAVSALAVLSAFTVDARRGAADAPAGRFTITAGGTPTATVLDTQTGLTWQQAAPAMAYTWTDAATYCTSNAGALPGAGWRLPSMTELQTIVDDSRTNPPIDPTAFPDTPIALFWTSSTYVLEAGMAWCIDFDAGYTYQGETAGTSPTTAQVRCVQ